MKENRSKHHYLFVVYQMKNRDSKGKYLKRDDQLDLVARYVVGECTSEERETVESDTELLEMVRLLGAHMETANPGEPDGQRWDVEAALRRVHGTLHIDGQTKPGGTTYSGSEAVPVAGGVGGNPIPNWRVIRTYGRIAAAFIFAIGVSYVAYTLSTFPRQPQQFSQIAYEFSTGIGQQKQLLLSDGTKVTLGPASKFGLSNGFGKGTRTVRLEGRAFFSVRHQSDPFIVRTKNGTIKDLGTKFDVKAWSGEHETQVTVTEGKVILETGVASGVKGVLVTAGQKSAAVRDSVVLKPVRADLSQVLAWLHGTLVFDHTPLRTVIASLERIYPFKFSVSDPSLLSKRLTASYSKQPLDAILKAITLSLDIGYRTKGEEIVFDSINANMHHEYHKENGR